MPFREQVLDTGFQAYQPQPLPEPPEDTRGGFLKFGENIELIKEATQAELEVWASAFRMENDILNTWDYLTRPRFAADPTFNLVERLKADGMFANYSDNFLGVASEEEYLSVLGRINQEQQDRATLQDAGVGGVLAMMGAGMISPTMLIPFVGGLRGGKAVAAGIGAGFAGGALQELPLQLAQETRTLEESVSSIAMSTVVGGVLGGAVAYSRRTVRDLADEALKVERANMALSRGDRTIPQAASVGAARASETPELTRMSPLPKALDPWWDAHITPITSAIGNVTIPNHLQNVPVIRSIAGKRLADLSPPDILKINPAYFNMRSSFAQAKSMTARLEDAGLQIDNAAPGGTVANRVRTYDAPLAQVIGKLEGAYSRYWYGAEEGVKPGAVTRAKLAGLRPKPGKLSAQQFRQAVGQALRHGDTHEIPEVAEMAQVLRTELYDPLFEIAKAEGLFKDIPEEVLGDSSYLNRVYDIDLIQMRQPEFEAILADSLNGKLTEEFREAFQRLALRAERDAERIADFNRPREEVEELREKFEQDLKDLEEGRDEDLAALEAEIADKRTAARTYERGTPERESLNEEARELERQGGEALGEVKERRATIRRRLKNLRRAQSALEERHQKKLDKIERAEELSFGTLRRLIDKGAKLRRDFEKLSDERLDAELSTLRNQFAEAAARFDKNEDRIRQAFDDEFEADKPTSPFVALAKVETVQFDRMTEVANRLGEVEDIDRAVASDMLDAFIDDATRRAQGIVERRAVRSARLREQAADLDPQVAAQRIRALEEGVTVRAQEFRESWRERGADDIDPVTGTADFKQYSRDLARDVTEKILGTNMRLPGMDVILQPRGAELARTLDIASDLLRSGIDGRSFLIDDAQELAVRYVRTLAPDIELHRAYGDFAPDLGRNVEFKKLNDEIAARVEFVQQEMSAGRNPDSGRAVSKPYTQEQIDRRSQEIQAEGEAVRRNLEAMIGRIRHTWGLPDDPRAMGARLGRVASNLNVLRFMGRVTISSLPDIGRPIQKYGLLRTMRHGYVPFIRGLARGQSWRDGLSQRHLRATGAALDVMLQSRSSQLFDVGDYVVRGSKFEKGLEAATSKIGIVALFDYWTSAMKQISGSVANARFADSLAVVAGGEKASARELQEATDFLAYGGVDGNLAATIWREMQKPGGADLVDGQWWPNTENWLPEARAAYNAFILREVNTSIITPSIDAPLFTDRNPVRRLIFQFKSFGMSATTRIFAAGLQQRDMAFLTGSMISLALGTLSYYTYANLVGGPVLREMEDALAEGYWEKFADEAINRSGLLGFGAEIQSIAAAVPALAPFATFSGDRITRRGGANLYETIAGPTFGDFANTAANIATGADEPTQATVRQARTLLPWQNHILFSSLYDQLEAAFGGLPERRE